MATKQKNPRTAKAPSDKRNLKYGSLSVALTVVFVALVIVVNIIATSLSAAYGWYTDMTASGLYSLSDTFTEKMESLLSDAGEPVYLNIVLMTEEDQFEAYDSRTALVYLTLKELTAKFDNIKLVAYNTTAHPELAERYKTTALDTPVLSDVVIELSDENHTALENVPAKKYAIESFFTTDSSSGSYIGYNAEAKLLSAVAQMLGKTDKPVAYYLQGHGEPSLSEESDWQEVLERAGFEVREINLSVSDFEIPESGICNDYVLVINRPKYDLLSTTELSEAKKIRAFMGTSYGNMIVVEDSSVPKLPALEALLSEYGLGFGGTVTDSQHSVSASGASKVLADYSKTYDADAESQDQAGQILSRFFGTRDNLPPTIFTSPKEVKLLDTTQVVNGINGSSNTFSLLKTYDTAHVSSSGDTTTVGTTTLLGMTLISWDVNSTERSWVAAIGASDFLDSSYENACANRSIAYEVLNLMWNNLISFDGVDYKEFDSYALTVSTAQANAWTIVCVVALPLAVAGLGVYVYVRRRHS